MAKRAARKTVEEVDKAVGSVDLVSESPITRWASTGCTVLDLAISNRFPGGFPIGRISHIYGAESTCKTVLGMTPLGWAQRQGGHAYFNDVENTYDAVWAKMYFGLDSGRKGQWTRTCTRTIEEFFDSYLRRVLQECKEDKDVVNVVVVDSLSAMTTDVEIDEALGDGTYGTSRAKQLSKGFRKYIRPIADANLSLIFIDQIRDKIGVLFGERHTVSGGHALEFYASVRVSLSHEKKVKNDRGQVVGEWLGFYIRKNKTAPPHREGRFKILYEYGIDNIDTSLVFLKGYQDMLAGEGSSSDRRKESQVVFGDVKKYVSKMVTYVEENDLEAELDVAVVDAWKDLYKLDDRKARVWR